MYLLVRRGRVEENGLIKGVKQNNEESFIKGNFGEGIK